MKRFLINSLLLLFVQYMFAQDTTIIESKVSVDKFTEGTLVLPKDSVPGSLVIFIQGSGPTNRDGNQPMMKNDGIKKIATSLAENGISSFRYDKRIFKMDQLDLQEENLRFEDFVTDVKSIVQYFKAKDVYRKIILAGHSEGSLIGMLAAQEVAVDAFISLAGAGRSIDTIIVEQLAKQSEELSQNARMTFDEIKQKGKTPNYHPFLESVFRPSVQPYIASWMEYDPARELAKLSIPVLLINGSFDIQVDTVDAKLLHEALPHAQLEIVEDMNHIFREIKGDNLENTKSYNESYRPLHPGLIPILIDFIKALE